MVTPSTRLVDLSHRRMQWQGFTMALLAAIFWGLSGVSAQRLFMTYHASAGWLVTVRMGISGFLILLVTAWRQGIGVVWQPWRSRQWRLQLIIFGIVGLFAVQYSYLAAIQDGNAASATLLQYTGPALITLYLIIRKRARPSYRQFTAVGLSLFGTWLLVSNGRFNSLHIPLGGLIWGLLSAVTLAFYTLYPGQLLQRWGSSVIVGWGMVIGSCTSQFIFPIWQGPRSWWPWTAWVFVAFVVLVGTLLAFWLYLASLNYIEPGPASVITSAEPLVATAASMMWLGVHLDNIQAVGALAIVSAVVILALRQPSLG
ncbi:MAG: EamA family transporter [Sulfobacillus thermosulfidooxidans]|uniref:EamA family transporter n=1 Tax=Sulfobacillus thermosulfidooxidans TaxID=28034 RepID=A0A2T2X5Q5_SULTH|nr:MAG: EamA family transporter [Sulfobacillus thermosulfidooxidans]